MNLNLFEMKQNIYSQYFKYFKCLINSGIQKTISQVKLYLASYEVISLSRQCDVMGYDKVCIQ